MCCGNRRKSTVASLPQRVEQRSGPLPQAEPARPPISFEYTGQTSLAVIGPFTRATYRFSAPGARVPVDARDAAAVAAVPHVRRAAG